MSSMPDVRPRLPVGCWWSWRYSKNQTAIFAPLTSVNTPHHQDRGFDQARELDRARHSKLMNRSRRNRCVTELTFDCSNTVTVRSESRQEYVCGGCLRGDGRVIASASLVGANGVGRSGKSQPLAPNP